MLRLLLLLLLLLGALCPDCTSLGILLTLQQPSALGCSDVRQRQEHILGKHHQVAV